QPALQLEQVEDVGSRIAELRLRERARRPVVLLPRRWEADAEVVLEEDVETERGSRQEARRDRGVEQRGEAEGVAPLEVCQIVVAGVEDSDPRGLVQESA